MDNKSLITSSAESALTNNLSTRSSIQNTSSYQASYDTYKVLNSNNNNTTTNNLNTNNSTISTNNQLNWNSSSNQLNASPIIAHTSSNNSYNMDIWNSNNNPSLSNDPIYSLNHDPSSNNNSNNANLNLNSLNSFKSSFSNVAMDPLSYQMLQLSTKDSLSQLTTPSLMQNTYFGNSNVNYNRQSKDNSISNNNSNNSNYNDSNIDTNQNTKNNSQLFNSNNFNVNNENIDSSNWTNNNSLNNSNSNNAYNNYLLQQQQKQLQNSFSAQQYNNNQSNNNNNSNYNKLSNKQIQNSNQQTQNLNYNDQIKQQQLQQQQHTQQQQQSSSSGNNNNYIHSFHANHFNNDNNANASANTMDYNKVYNNYDSRVLKSNQSSKLSDIDPSEIDNYKTKIQLKDIIISKLELELEKLKDFQNTILKTQNESNSNFEVPKNHEELYHKLVEKCHSTEVELEDTKTRLESLVTAISMNNSNNLNSTFKNGRYDEEEISHKIISKLKMLTEENDELSRMVSYGKSKEKDIEIALLRKQNNDLLEKIAKLEAKLNDKK